MNSGPVPPFLNELRDHQLLTGAQLAEAGKLPAASAADPRPLAKELLQRGWLTPYQVNQIVQGRGKELAVGPYRVLDRLGEGPAGKTFKARHVSAERLYAIKLLSRTLIVSPQAADTFARHTTQIQGLKAPFLARVCDAPVVGDNLVIVSEYVDGTDLARLVQKSGRLPVAKALDYIRQAASALQFLHQAGLAHRNIKPSNLLLCQPTAEGPETIKLLDLGQAPFGNGDIRADLFALGGTWFYLLTGQMPRTNSSFTQLRPDVPPPAQEVLGKLLAKRPEDRFQTPADLLAALRQTVVLPPAPVTATAPKTTASSTAQTLAGTAQTLAGELIVQSPAASPRKVDSKTDQTLMGDLIAPAASPRKVDSKTDQTLMGDLIAQVPTAPPKEKTILGELVGPAPTAPAREKTILGELVGPELTTPAISPETQAENEAQPVWLGNAIPLSAPRNSGTRKLLQVASAFAGAGVAALVILGLASLLGQYSIKRKAVVGAAEDEVAQSKHSTTVAPAFPEPVRKTDPKQTESEPKAEPEPKPQPKVEPKPEPEPDDVASLIKRLKEPDEAKRLKAAEQLEKMGRAAKDAIPALTEALKDRHVGVRLVAATTLGRFGPGAKGAVQGLIEAVREDEISVRSAALSALGSIGPDAKAACPDLVVIVKNTKHANRTEAAQALAHIGGIEIAPLWLELLNGKDKQLAKIALPALEAIGKLKYPQLTGLVEALKNENPEIRAYAAKAIGQIGPDARWTVRKVMKSVEDSDPEVKKNAIVALGKIGPKAEEAAPLLVGCLKQAQFHDAAAESLVSIGKGAVPDLVAILKNDESKRTERIDAATILGDIGPDARGAVDQLKLTATNDQYPTVQRAAKAALAKIRSKR